MMFFGKATVSSPIRTPKTMASSGYQLALVGSGEFRVVQGRDAALGASVGVAEWAVVDPHATPGGQAPVDGRVLIVEERLPPLLERGEDGPLHVDVAGELRQVPGDQVVGQGTPTEVGEFIQLQT